MKQMNVCQFLLTSKMYKKNENKIIYLYYLVVGKFTSIIHKNYIYILQSDVHRLTKYIMTILLTFITLFFVTVVCMAISN